MIWWILYLLITLFTFWLITNPDKISIIYVITKIILAICWPLFYLMCVIIIIHRIMKKQ